MHTTVSVPSAVGTPDAPAPQTDATSRWARSSLTRNVAANWVTLLCGIAYTLLITPIVVRALGAEGYGVWSFLNGLATYADLFYFGLGAALVKYVAQFRVRNERAAMQRLCSVVFTTYCAIGALVLGIAVVISPLIPSLLGTDLRDTPPVAAVAACVLLGARLTALFAGSVFSGIVLAYDRNDAMKVVMIAFTALRFALVPLLVDGPNALVTLAVITTATAWLEVFALAWLAREVTHRLPLRFCLPTFADLRPLYSFGFQSFLIVVSTKITTYTDTTVIGLTLGADAVANYALPLQLAEYARYAILAIVSVLLPTLVTLHASGETDKLGPVFVRVARISLFAAAIGSVCFVTLGPAFLAQWVGPSMVTPATQWVLFWLGLTTFCQVLSTQVPLPFFQSLHLLRVPVLILAVEAIVNLVGSVQLVGRYGTPGVAFATFLPCFAISFVLIPRYLCRVIRLPFARTMLVVLMPAVAAATTVFAVLTAMQLVTPTRSFVAITASGTAAVGAAFVVFMLTFPARDLAIVPGALRLRAAIMRMLLGMAAAVVVEPATAGSNPHIARVVATITGGDQPTVLIPIGGRSAAGRLISWLRAVLLVPVATTYLAAKQSETTSRLGLYPSVESPSLAFELSGGAGAYARRFLVPEPTSGLLGAVRVLLGRVTGTPTAIGGILIVGVRG